MIALTKSIRYLSVKGLLALLNGITGKKGENDCDIENIALGGTFFANNN